MKKILISLVCAMMFGLSNIALAVEAPEMVETEVQEEIITEEEIEVEEDQEEEFEEDQDETTTEDEDEVEDEDEEEVEEIGCPHNWGEWEYDLTEHDDGSITCFRYCDCGQYEELDEQTYCDLGGQYENCDAGRHYWCEEDGIRYCEECGYVEEGI